MKKTKSSFKDNDPYRFELTRDFLERRKEKIEAKKYEIQTETGIKKENENK